MWLFWCVYWCEITLDGAANANKRNKGTAFKNNASFISLFQKLIIQSSTMQKT